MSPKKGQPDFDAEAARIDRELEELIQPALKAIAEHREAASGDDVFTAATEQELRRKLTRHNSPTITSQSWSGSVPVGGTLNYSVGLFNPDPVAAHTLFVHVFVGPANMVPDVGQALATVDTRWPRLTMPSFFGLTLQPNTGANLAFALAVPPGIQQGTNYLGNSFLFQGSWHDRGTYFDRGLFVFGVT